MGHWMARFWGCAALRSCFQGWVTIAMLGAGAAPLAYAADVSGSYEGVVTADSGLGVIGETLRFDYTYDDATVGSPSGAGHFYTNPLVSATITIASDVWTYNGGFNSIFLYNDDVIVLATGPEDRVTLGASNFIGPDYGTGASGPDVFSFSLTLSDNEPSGFPDGLSDDAVLPNPAPDADLFSNSTGAIGNSMRLSWFIGNPETGTIYTISTTDVASAAAPVPIPAALLLLLALGCVAILAARGLGARASRNGGDTLRTHG